MILVVALNPALDVTHRVAGVDWTGTNRPFAVQARAGGKALNVARTLRALGRPVTVTGPAIVKPNLAELEATTATSLRGADGPDLAAVERASRTLVALGAGAAVTSLGPDGLLAVTAEGTWHARPPAPVPGNPTGAGDAVVAGL